MSTLGGERKVSDMEAILLDIGGFVLGILLYVLIFERHRKD